jgi:hypothetical protein
MLKHIKIKECGIPELTISLPKFKSKKRVTPFDLSSHKRAREAIDLGMKMRAPDFNIFIIGKSRTRRILGTSQYVQTYLDQLPPPSDWVYLNNFQQKNKPRYYRFPSGTGKDFKNKLFSCVHKIQITLLTVFMGDSFSKAVKKEERNRKIFTYGETHTHAHTLKEKRNNESDNVFLTFNTSSTFISLIFISSNFIWSIIE